MNNPESTNIRAVIVNHNTSMYTELALRSFFAMHEPPLDISVTVVDNASDDDMSDLEAYTQKMGIRILQSGFTVAAERESRGRHGAPHGLNCHGEVLTDFVVANPECKYYLFLDTDVCFIEKNAIPTMMTELQEQQKAFGVGARQSHGGGTLVDYPNANPDVYESRLHPCCALIKNSQIFRTVVNEVGMSDVNFLWARGQHIYPTCKLMTRVMKTHGLRHIISSAVVIHMFGASFNLEARKDLDEWCMDLIRPFREQENSEPCAAPDTQ